MTDLPYLASRLYGTPLLIARSKLEVILGVVARKLAGGSLAAAPPSGADAALAGGLQILEGIAVIPILGTLVRRFSYLGAASGLTSYHDIEAMAEQAFADGQVKAVLLEIDSSGGEAGGVFDLAQRLRTLAQSSPHAVSLLHFLPIHFFGATMAILTASGRAALAAAIKEQTLHLALGEGDPLWDTTKEIGTSFEESGVITLGLR